MNPNLFIIGAMKAGTSSLHEYLHQHPQIFMSRFKEPQYFAPHVTRWGQEWGQGNPYPEPGIDWYMRLFEQAGDVAYSGESSVNYSARPWMEGCAERIFEFNPDAKFIYLVRDPIERSISHYWHFVKDGREDLPMLTAFQRRPDYVDRSDYAMQMAPYLQRFGAEKIFVMSLEELLANPDEIFVELFRWLGIATDVSIDTRERHNVGDERLRQSRRGMVFMDTILKHWRWSPWIKRLPNFAQVALAKGVYRSVDRERISVDEAVEYLRPILQPKATELFELIGREFGDWRTLFPATSGVRNELTSTVS